MKKTALKLLLVLLPTAAMVLCALPRGLRMVFAAPGGQEVVFCPYYAGLPVQFGNWGGLLTLILSAVLCVVYGGLALRDYPTLRRCAPLIGCVAVLAAVLPVLFGSMTVIGWCIFALLLVQTVLSFWARKI